METKFKSLSVFEFQRLFPDEKSCINYLADLKWKKGYTCPKCGHSHFCKGVNEYDRQCTRCRYNESPTAGTLFHKIKFSLHKAFWIVYFTATNKKGISSTELSRKLQLRQKTAWLFRQKVMRAMSRKGSLPLKGRVIVDEFVAGFKKNKSSKVKKPVKKLVVFAIEENGIGISRIYGQVIKKSNAGNLGDFISKTVDHKAKIKTNGKNGYTPLKKNFNNLTQDYGIKKSRSLKLIKRVSMGFKAWLRGIHHHAEHLQAYVDEYSYRFNKSKMKENVFNNLMIRMVEHPPVYYKNIIA